MDKKSIENIKKNKIKKFPKSIDNKIKCDIIKPSKGYEKGFDMYDTYKEWLFDLGLDIMEAKENGEDTSKLEAKYQEILAKYNACKR